jgi:hypothetical protein
MNKKKKDQARVRKCKKPLALMKKEVGIQNV